MGVAMLDVIPYKTLFRFEKFWIFFITATCTPQNIMTRKPQIGNMTNITKLCPFLESKSGTCDLSVKTINMEFSFIS